MTYTMPEVDRHAQNTATVVIAVGVGDINLALRKPATESSTYTYSMKVLLIDMGAEVCFIRNTNLVVA
jgi:hypothetical protein